MAEQNTLPHNFVKRTYIRIRAEQLRKAKQPPNYLEAEREFERFLKAGIVVKVGAIGIANQVFMYSMKKN